MVVKSNSQERVKSRMKRDKRLKLYRREGVQCIDLKDLNSFGKNSFTMQKVGVCLEYVKIKSYLIGHEWHWPS